MQAGKQQHLECGCKGRRRLAWLGCMLMLLPALAQAERWYKVEALVFKRAAWFESADPALSPLQRTPELYDAIELTPPPTAEAAQSAEVQLGAFQQLPEAALNLMSAASRLDRSLAFEPLVYVAWVQPNTGLARARKVRLREPEPLPTLRLPPPADVTPGGTQAEAPTSLSEADGLSSLDGDRFGEQEAISATDGFLRLRVGRTLNVDLDVYHQDGPLTVRLAESRRVLFNDIHYFDHPGLGVLVRIAPVELGD